MNVDQCKILKKTPKPNNKKTAVFPVCRWVCEHRTCCVYHQLPDVWNEIKIKLIVCSSASFLCKISPATVYNWFLIFRDVAWSNHTFLRHGSRFRFLILYLFKKWGYKYIFCVRAEFIHFHLYFDDLHPTNTNFGFHFSIYMIISPLLPPSLSLCHCKYYFNTCWKRNLLPLSTILLFWLGTSNIIL